MSFNHENELSVLLRGVLDMRGRTDPSRQLEGILLASASSIAQLRSWRPEEARALLVKLPVMCRLTLLRIVHLHPNEPASITVLQKKYNDGHPIGVKQYKHSLVSLRRMGFSNLVALESLIIAGQAGVAGALRYLLQQNTTQTKVVPANTKVDPRPYTRDLCNVISASSLLRSAIFHMKQSRRENSVSDSEHVKCLQSIGASSMDFSNMLTQHDLDDVTEASLLCAVCLSGRRTRLFVACRHLVLCASCANSVDWKNCPVCKAQSTELVEIYTP